MSSIPLPALSVHAPEQPNLLQQVSQIQSLKGMMGQQQIQQQQQQSGAIDLQMKQQQQKDQQTVMQVLSAHGGNLQSALPELSGKISPQTFMGLDKYNLEKQKDLAEIDSKELATKQDTNSRMLQLIDTASKLPPDQYAAQYPQIAAAAKQLKPDLKIDPAQMIPQQMLPQFGLGLQTEAQYIAQEKAKRDAKEFADKEPGIIADASKKVRDLQNGPSGAEAEAKYRFILARGVKASPEDINWAKSYEAANTKSTSTSDSLGIKSTSTSGPSGLSRAGVAGGGNASAPGGLNSAGSTLVDEIGTGKMAANRLDMLLTKRPELLQAVAAKYPDFDSSKVKSYGEAYRSFTSGADVKQVNAGAVAIQHLAELKKLNDDHSVAVHVVGTDAYNRFHNLLDTVADELVTFYGEPKTNEAMAAKKSTLGALTNRTGAIEEQAKAMGVKFDELSQKWLNAAPSASYQAPMPGMSKKAMEARATLDSEYAASQKEQSAAAPQTHTFSVRAWAQANPKGNMAAAKAAAEAQGYQVIP